MGDNNINILSYAKLNNLLYTRLIYKFLSVRRPSSKQTQSKLKPLISGSDEMCFTYDYMSNVKSIQFVYIARKIRGWQ